MTEEKARSMMREYVSKFPDVEVISSNEIKSLLQNSSRPHVVLIDVREKEEVEVSKIPGAITMEEFNRMTDENMISKEETICIPYCTMGYRSGKFATEIKNHGFKNVRNGEGIVLWTYAKGDLVTTDATGAEVSTKRVHTYGAQWNLVSPEYDATYGNWWNIAYKNFLNVFNMK